MSDMTRDEIEKWRNAKVDYDDSRTLEVAMQIIDQLLRQPPPSQTAREIAGKHQVGLAYFGGAKGMVCQGQLADDIQSAIDAAVREHNEACAKVADDEWDSSCPVGHELESPVAAAIRSLLPTKAGQEDTT